jgi:GNAT superfamily N-acetyltransferase
MDIRAATVGDSHQISALINRVAHFFTLRPDGLGAEDFLKTISPDAIAHCIAAPQFRYYAGFLGDHLVGVAAMRENRHLYHLFVAPEYQRRGFGRQLWEFARAESLGLGNQGEFTVNSTLFAVPAYASFGFVATGAPIESHGIAYVPMKLVRADNAG